MVEHGAQHLIRCIGCLHQTSLTAGGLMEHIKLLLTSWFLAIHLINQAKTGPAVLPLKRQLGVSYLCLWLLHRKIDHAMAAREACSSLTGAVQVDGTYLGGERAGGKRARGWENKVPFVTAISRNSKNWPQFLILSMVSGSTSGAIGRWARACLQPGRAVRSGALACFAAVTAAGCAHHPVVVGERRPRNLPQFLWLNTVLGNLKSTLASAFQSLRYRKYATHYPATFACRFNRRFDLSGLVWRLIVEVALCVPTPGRVVGQPF